MDDFSSNLLTASLDFMALDKSLSRLHVYSHFDYWVKENIFERRLRTRGDSFCFINWHCVDFYAVRPVISLGLFVHIPDWWRAYKCSRFLFVPIPIFLAYYSNLFEFGNKSLGF